jgi:hypothetical protein
MKIIKKFIFYRIFVLMNVLKDFMNRRKFVMNAMNNVEIVLYLHRIAQIALI